MEKISVLGLLKKYDRWLKNGQIQFLKKGTRDYKLIGNLVGGLIADFKNAEKKPGDLSENLDWHETHEKGRELWKELASAALNSIDENSKGNLELYEFLKAATEFEDLLYGLEPYYRDHTLHSLWVYLIGEYILRDLLPQIYSNLNWYLYNDIEEERTDYTARLVRIAGEKEKKLCNRVNQIKDAIWCIIALCHDLGYSLAKLKNLNEKAENVLRYFHLPNFKQIGYTLDIEHQYVATQFLELMAMDVRIVSDISKKEELIKCYRDDSTYWRLCRALERKQHGILSSYLLYKLLGIFADSWVRGPAEEWGLSDDEAFESITRGDILFAIAQHEFDFAFINELGGLSEILFLADELEEFSRLGRPLLSRKYHDTTAFSGIKFSPKNPKQGDQVDIHMEYDVARHLNRRDFFNFFLRKSEKICKIYSLEQISPKTGNKYCKIYSINMSVSRESERLTIQICKDPSKNRALLPATSLDTENFTEGWHKVACIDDKIYHIREDGNRIELKDWLDNAN